VTSRIIRLYSEFSTPSHAKEKPTPFNVDINGAIFRIEREMSLYPDTTVAQSVRWPRAYLPTGLQKLDRSGNDGDMAEQQWDDIRKTEGTGACRAWPERASQLKLSAPVGLRETLRSAPRRLR
jgi:hypothetical protein